MQRREGVYRIQWVLYGPELDQRSLGVRQMKDLLWSGGHSQLWELGRKTVQSVPFMSVVEPEFTEVRWTVEKGCGGKLKPRRRTGASGEGLELVSPSSLPALMPHGVTHRKSWHPSQWSWCALCLGLGEAKQEGWRELRKFKSRYRRTPTKGHFRSMVMEKAATVLGTLYHLHRIEIMWLLLRFLLPNLMQYLPCVLYYGTVFAGNSGKCSSLSAPLTQYSATTCAFGHSGLILSGRYFLTVSVSGARAFLLTTPYHSRQSWPLSSLTSTLPTTNS